jgi:hypothetical protein
MVHSGREKSTDKVDCATEISTAKNYCANGMPGWWRAGILLDKKRG